METEGQDRRKQKGGQYCFARGCKNEFYKVKAKDKAVHFHKLPLKWKTILLCWLTALKRVSPPMGIDSRVCIDLFSEDNYIEEKTF